MRLASGGLHAASIALVATRMNAVCPFMGTPRAGGTTASPRGPTAIRKSTQQQACPNLPPTTVAAWQLWPAHSTVGSARRFSVFRIASKRENLWRAITAFHDR